MSTDSEPTPASLEWTDEGEVVSDGTDPQATDVSDDVDVEMIRDDYRNDKA